ncbi:hypothetical protein COOONC_16432 [Cooperia oncophora]
MSAMELIKNIMELNRDPVIENMLIALSEKIPKEFSDFLESNKRDRSIDLETPMSSPLYRKVCLDVDHHLKKFISNFERHLGSQASLKRLHQYIRNKFKSKSSVPTLKDQFGSILVSEREKAEALGRFFAGVFSASSSSTGVMEDANIDHAGAGTRAETNKLLKEQKRNLPIPAFRFPVFAQS